MQSHVFAETQWTRLKIIPATWHCATATIMSKDGAKLKIIWEITFEQRRGEAVTGTSSKITLICYQTYKCYLLVWKTANIGCLRFSEEQTDKLIHGHTINYSCWLHSNEYRRNALANYVTAEIIKDDKRNLFLLINQKPIAQWFREQFCIGREQRRGLRIWVSMLNLWSLASRLLSGWGSAVILLRIEIT